jgi:2-oxoglutarate dehydrogenase E2 component (dihydrolipoamide succinyltransferase)
MEEDAFILVRWLKENGEFVHEDEPICDLESDKASVEMPAWTSGYLRQFAQAGDTIHITDEFARIDREKP